MPDPKKFCLQLDATCYDNDRCGIPYTVSFPDSACTSTYGDIFCQSTDNDKVCEIFPSSPNEARCHKGLNNSEQVIVYEHCTKNKTSNGYEFACNAPEPNIAVRDISACCQSSPSAPCTGRDETGAPFKQYRCDPATNTCTFTAPGARQGQTMQCDSHTADHDSNWCKTRHDAFSFDGTFNNCQ